MIRLRVFASKACCLAAILIYCAMGSSFAELAIPDETDAEIILRQQAEETYGTDHQPTRDLQAFCDAGLDDDIVLCLNIDDLPLGKACNIDILIARRMREKRG